MKIKPKTRKVSRKAKKVIPKAEKVIAKTRQNSHKINEKNHTDSNIACFGKLPYANDYIKYRLDQPRFFNVDHWLYQAYQHLCYEQQGICSPTLIKKLPNYYFIEVLDDSQTPLIACVKPSTDAVGRDYPFTTMHLVTQDVAKQYVSIIPLMYREFFNTTSNVGNTIKFSCQDKDMNLLINNILTSLPMDQVKCRLQDIIIKLRSITLRELAADYLLINQRLSFIELLYGHIAKLRQLNRKNTDMSSKCYKLPLPLMKDNYDYITFWLLLLKTIYKNMNHKYYVIWHDGMGEIFPMMYVYFGSVPVDFIAQMLYQGSNHNSGDCDVDDDGNDNDCGGNGGYGRDDGYDGAGLTSDAKDRVMPSTDATIDTLTDTDILAMNLFDFVCQM